MFPLSKSRSSTILKTQKKEMSPIKQRTVKHHKIEACHTCSDLSFDSRRAETRINLAKKHGRLSKEGRRMNGTQINIERT